MKNKYNVTKDEFSAAVIRKESHLASSVDLKIIKIIPQPRDQSQHH